MQMDGQQRPKSQWRGQGSDVISEGVVAVSWDWERRTRAGRERPDRIRGTTRLADERDESEPRTVCPWGHSRAQADGDRNEAADAV